MQEEKLKNFHHRNKERKKFLISCIILYYSEYSCTVTVLSFVNN